MKKNGYLCRELKRKYDQSCGIEASSTSHNFGKVVSGKGGKTTNYAEREDRKDG